MRLHIALILLLTLPLDPLGKLGVDGEHRRTVDTGSGRPERVEGAASASSAQTNPLWHDEKIKNYLPHMTWPEVQDLLTRTDVVILPVPALEQHGLHGPIGTDFF